MSFKYTSVLLLSLALLSWGAYEMCSGLIEGDRLGAFLFAVFNLMAVWNFREVYLSQQSTSWPQAEGRVVGAGTSTGYDQAWGIDHSPSVRYSYVVDSKDYFGQRIHFGFSPSFSYFTASRIAKRIGDAEQVKVFYSPNNAQLSVLEPGFRLEVCIVPLLLSLLPALLLFAEVWT